ncbi:hypothetical protein BV25DRAFT_1818321 [Artomyces pyxidatus]|uniref:Uncharacterized protein n=1 Tax=Artomyces pyxidatus TaxID=48021 RepID=A0ACB8THV2_9AGAM|nr:hypothetical protein BV25DRAFT_1818321 [Artomyces pyxidatus]
MSLSTEVAVAVDEVRSQIDDDLRHLENSVLSLKARRNALAPIARLPPEALAMVFAFIAEDCSWYATQAERLAWMKVAHVSHHWREIALSHARLWTRIEFSSFLSASVMLTRARAAPITIDVQLLADPYVRPCMSIRLTCPVNEEALILGLQHMWHVSQLRLSVPRLFLFDNLFDKFPSSAPSLQALSLSTEAWDPTYPPEIAALPNDLFAKGIPNLQHLSLTNFDFSWNSPWLKGLRSLRLVNLSIPARPSMTTFLDALESMDRIEELFFHQSTPISNLPDAELQVSESDRVVTLQHLRAFDLSTLGVDCAYVTRHLSLPQVRSVRIDCYSVRPDGSDFLPILPSFRRLAHGTHDASPLQSMTAVSADSFLYVSTWLEPDPSESQPPRAVLAASGSLWRPGTDYKLTMAAFASLPLTDVRSVSVQNMAPAHLDLWLVEGARWRKLERLRLIGESAQDFTQASLVNGAQVSDSEVVDPQTGLPDTSALLFPELQSLTLVSASLWHGCETEELVDALRERNDLGVVLPELAIIHSAVSRLTVNRLSSFVLDITWQGRRPEELIGDELAEFGMPLWPTMFPMPAFADEPVFGDFESDEDGNDSLTEEESDPYGDDEDEEDSDDSEAGIGIGIGIGGTGAFSDEDYLFHGY